jgi:hypothetical protein
MVAQSQRGLSFRAEDKYEVVPPTRELPQAETPLLERRIVHMKNGVALVGLTILLAGCVTVNKSILDRSFMTTPVPKEGVHVYLPGDEVPGHTRVAILNAEGDVEMTDEGEMIDKLREEAGKLGANAIIMGEIKDPGTGAVVANAILGTEANRKTQAIAIFVPSLKGG